MARKGISVNEVAARKAIQRASQSGLIESTSPVRFDKVFLYYLADHKSKNKGRQYAKGIRDALSDKPSHNRVFKTLLANKGWITFGQIGKASACLPEGEKKRIGGRKSLDRVISELDHLGLIEDVAGTKHVYRLGKLFGSPTIGRGTFLYYLRIEQQLLDGALPWLKNTYLLAYDGSTHRKSETEAKDFNQTYWDVHGPIYLGPHARNSSLRRTAVKENFLVVELLAYRTFSAVDADALIERCKSIVLRWKTIAVTPIVIARFFSPEAWHSLRRAGVGAVLIGDVFGKNIDALLRAIWATLSESKPPEEQIGEIEKALAIASGTVDDWGIVGHLKGTLFEFLIALAWKVAGWDVKMQKALRRMPNDEYEIDVFAVRGSQCKLIECKGHHAEYRECKEEVARHFDDRCEAAADTYGWDITNRYDDVEAIFVTSGELDEEAREYANDKTKSHGIACTVQTRVELMAWLKDLGQDHLRDILDRYYLRPPPAFREDQLSD